VGCWPGSSRRSSWTYATWNPEDISFYHRAIAPIVGDAPPASGSLAFRFIAGILFALCAGVVWLLIEQRVVSASSARAIGHIALTAVALLLAVGMSWSHVSRRLSGQLDTDEVN
jgi:Family of unknown function (DUF6524)